MTSTTPTNGAINVALTAPITLTFSEDMDPSTMSSSNLYIDGLTSTVTYASATRTATLTPSTPYPQYTQVYAHVTTGVRDLAGLAMAAQLDLTFRSKDPGPPRVTSTQPANTATGVARSTSVYFFFNEYLAAATINTTNINCSGVPINTYFMGDNLAIAAQGFNGWPNDALITCHLTTAITDLDGLPLAAQYDFTFHTVDNQGPFIVSRVPDVNATGVSISSTVKATFSEALDPATLTTSSFSVIGRTGTVSYDPATFTVTWADAAPFSNATVYSARVTGALHDLAGNVAFATTWSFTTETDVTPPQVVSTAPANNATNVLQALGRISAVFSEPMTASTLTNSTFTCTKTVGTTTSAEPGTVGFNATLRTATFVPVAPFTYGARYTCTLAVGIKDAAGNALAAPYVFAFTVESDTYPPRVLSSNPTRLGHFFPVSGALTVTFDEAVNAGTVNATNLKVNGVTATVSYDSGTRTATLTPTAALSPNRGYVLTVTGVSDTAGHALTAPIQIEFRTTPTSQKVSATTVPQYRDSKVVQLTNGVLHLVTVWNGLNEYELHYAYTSGGSWTFGNLGPVSSITDLWAAAYSSNRAGVAWRDGTGTRQFSSFDGFSWTLRVAIGDEFGTVLAGGDKLGMLSRVGTGSGVEVRFFDGASWSAPTQLSTTGLPNSLAYNGTEWLAVWRYQTGTIGDYHVYARAFDGTTWGPTADLISFPVPQTPNPRWAIASNPGSFAVAFADVGNAQCAVRVSGAWQPAATSGFGGAAQFTWFQLAANGTGYAWAYTAGSSVWDLYYRIWDGTTQTWSAVPTLTTAVLGRGRSIALTSSGTDYFIAQELLTSGVKAHRFSGGAWTNTTFSTTGPSPVGPIIASPTRTAISWSDGAQWWSAIFSGAWGAAARLDSGNGLAELQLARIGTALHAFMLEDEDQHQRVSATGTTFAAPVTVSDLGLNGAAATPRIAFADDGRGLAVWQQWEAGHPRLFARYWDGAAWVGAPFRVSTLHGQQPVVATNGTRWVIGWVESNTGALNAWRASWTLAGGVTAPVMESAGQSVTDVALASTDGTFLLTWVENRDLKAKLSADGLTFGPREDVANLVDIYAPLRLVAVPGTYALAYDSTLTRERGITAASPWSNPTARSGVCALAPMQTTYGGACAAPTFGAPLLGFVNTQPTTTLQAVFAGPVQAVGGFGDRLRAVWPGSVTTARDYDPYFDWGAPQGSPVQPLALADDSLHFFAIASQTGGIGLDVYVEGPPNAFTLQQTLAPPVVHAATLWRGRGEVGALWTSPQANGRDEVWGANF
ncbi:MAG: Ig-like domain-containing protein [Archangiaceae bacterium]|nr:Ig-like domain-containing protein [Archangiaceae bacterium]